MTHCTQKEFEFQVLNTRKVIGLFDGGTITSDGGSLLLREIEAGKGIIKKFADCFTDYRNPDYTEHSVYEMACQRIYGIALGYEDLNEHETLRNDPLLAILSGKEDPTGQTRRRKRDKGKALAGKSTLNRLELTPCDAGKQSRYKKIVYNEKQMEDYFVEIFLQSYKKPPKQIILDLDATDSIIHGKQEGRFFHGYYGNYCYLPLYIFCGDFLLCAKLRTSNRDASDGAQEEVERIVKKIREVWSDTRIILRGDSGFCREKLMSWCEENGVDYVFGFAKDGRVKREIEEELKEAKRLFEEKGQAQRVYKDFMYRTLKSWPRNRRMIGKAEHLEKGANPRFVVTSLEAGEIDAKNLYEKMYCARGDMENRIKEQQLYLFSDRMSSETMRANQLRLWFSSVAYLLLSEFRRTGLKSTALAKAQCHTIRNKLLKIGAQIKISVRRILISFASGYPYQDIFWQIYRRLRKAYC